MHIWQMTSGSSTQDSWTVAERCFLRRKSQQEPGAAEMHPIQTQLSAPSTAAAAAATKALSLQHLTAALHTLAALLETSEAAGQLAVASCGAAVEGSGAEAAAQPGRQCEAQQRPRVVVLSRGGECEPRPKQQSSLPLDLYLMEELRSASDQAGDCVPFTIKLILLLLGWGNRQSA